MASWEASRCGFVKTGQEKPPKGREGCLGRRAAGFPPAYELAPGSEGAAGGPVGVPHEGAVARGAHWEWRALSAISKQPRSAL